MGIESPTVVYASCYFAACFPAFQLVFCLCPWGWCCLFMPYSFFVLSLGSRLCIYSAGDRCLGHLGPFTTTSSSVLSVFVCISMSVGSWPALGCTPPHPPHRVQLLSQRPAEGLHVGATASSGQMHCSHPHQCSVLGTLCSE